MYKDLFLKVKTLHYVFVCFLITGPLMLFGLDLMYLYRGSAAEEGSYPGRFIDM